MIHLEIFLTFLRLGLTSFGGPIAHLSYFHEEFVKKKKWINEHAYAELVALCQFLPGPASSQVGMAIGFFRGGILGSIIAWFAFTIPSAIILIIFGLGLSRFTNFQQNWLHALKIIAVSVVAQAVLGMWKKLCPDKERMMIAIFSSAFMLIFPSAFTQIAILIIAGLIGIYFLKGATDLPLSVEQNQLNKKIGSIFLSLFFIILIALPILRVFYQEQWIKIFDSFYRSGSLVFGGGHVVLPLLQKEVVPTGWVSNDLFMAGYGLAQAIPGPLFTFTAYLGTVSKISPNGWGGAFISLIAAFLPAFLLILGVLPFWENLRKLARVRQGMLGVNAAVVGILLAALYHPVWTSAIFNLKDFVVALIGLILLEIWKLPSWLIVILAIIFSFV